MQGVSPCVEACRAFAMTRSDASSVVSVSRRSLRPDEQAQSGARIAGADSDGQGSQRSSPMASRNLDQRRHPSNEYGHQPRSTWNEDAQHAGTEKDQTDRDACVIPSRARIDVRDERAGGKRGDCRQPRPVLSRSGHLRSLSSAPAPRVRPWSDAQPAPPLAPTSRWSRVDIRRSRWGSLLAARESLAGTQYAPQRARS
jgi:hypothetical protein